MRRMLFPMRRFTPTSILLLCIASLPVGAETDGDGNDRKELASELGAILAWRLGPEAVEEACRPVHPEGIEARKKAVQSWLEKNAQLIAEVDARVAEVVTLAFSPEPTERALAAVRRQVKGLLLEPMFEDRTPEEARKICESEAEDANPRWANSGIREVQLSLAALYDWKVRHTRASGKSP